MSFLVGTKKEMTQVFKEDGTVLPVTIIDIDGAIVVGLKTHDRDGYNAVVIGYGKKKKSNKAETRKFKELGFTPKYIAEFRTDSLDGFEVGKPVGLDQFNESVVDVSGVSKGKGFAGVVKRWGFAGGPKTHGQSDRHRAPGSIGSGTTPGRVFKGKKMPGRMGGENTTVKNLRVVRIDKDNNLLLVKGAVPGVKGGLIKIKKSR